MPFQFYVDFDGTVSIPDTTDTLLERFADPQWRQIEDDWLAGRIGSRECLARQIALITATPEQIEEALRLVDVDPDFPEFLTQARRIGVPVTIVSDGFDLCIQTLLARDGIGALPIVSNELVHLGDGKWRARFPNASSSCTALSGSCKCAVPDTASATILIGDGRSDFCLARRADLVLAKGKLADFCRAEGLGHIPIASFADVCDWLESVDEPANKPASAGIHPFMFRSDYAR